MTDERKAPAGRVIHDKEREETADMVMDLLLEADSANTAHRSREEIDDEARQEKQFMRSFHIALNERLQGTGLFCMGVLPDGQGRGYRVYCKDRVGRPYECDLGFAEWLDRSERVGADAGRQMVTVVVERLLAARANWFRRMQ